MTRPEHLAASVPNPWVLKAKDVAERAASAFGEQFLSIVLFWAGAGTSATLTGLPWAIALSTSAGAAVVSILLSIVQFSIPGGQTPPYWLDLVTRVSKTFAASLLGTLGGGATFDVLHVSWVHALNIAALSAVLSLVKNLLSPNAHLSGSLLSTPTVAAIHGVSVNGSGFSKAA